MEFLQATPEQDEIILRHYLAVWDSYGTPAKHFRDDAESIVRGFLEIGRRERSLASFIAFDGGVAIGSVSCQLHAMPYPAVLKPEHMLQGYVWSVYVDPAYRKQGISTKLTSLAVEYLRGIGCTGVVLHSSEAGESLYRSLGFEIAREMRLKLEE